MKKLILILTFLGLVVVIAIGTLSEKDYEPTLLMQLKEKYPKSEKPSVNHSRFANELAEKGRLQEAAELWMQAVAE